MINKRGKRNSDEVRVTFSLPADHPQADSMVVVGDFNGWDPSANPLKRRSNGLYSTAITLEKGNRYAFRYRSESGEWFNDAEADAYEHNDFGEQNCILAL